MMKHCLQLEGLERQKFPNFEGGTRVLHFAALWPKMTKSAAFSLQTYNSAAAVSSI